MPTKQQKEWVDARGQKVPVGYVSKYDKARDKPCAASSPVR